ncbi:MAG TPA: redoxin domain-containing protein [Candidatus Sulfotelmatobacter sp.]|jgi:peroxiredoxin|nr:redoxin domain-containing protein [Candidatus Sulfotelmatobacter sp.]
MQPSKKRRVRSSEKKAPATKRAPVSLKTKKIVKIEASVLGPGKIAPNFSLNSTPDQKVSLNDFRGQPVVLAFYPADWSPVCTDQLSLYAMVMPEFKKFNAELLAISVDNIWSHLAFAKDRKLNFPVLADFEPKGSISKKYGAYKEKIGESARALFVIDDKGIIRWSHLSPDGINPGADGILLALENLNKAQATEKS